MEATQEIEFSCPYCGSPISMVVENHYSHQSYTEDCEVCCRPIRLYYEILEDGKAQFEVGQEND